MLSATTICGPARGRNPPFLAVEHPPRPFNSAMQNRRTIENDKGARKRLGARGPGPLPGSSKSVTRSGLVLAHPQDELTPVDSPCTMGSALNTERLRNAEAAHPSKLRVVRIDILG